MNTTIRKIGNSEGIIIPKELLKKFGFSAGDNVIVVDEGDHIALKKASDSPEEFERKMEIARMRMKKYSVALRELAK